ncbi:MAG: T9SS type A sorting domain-containing protein [Flavobacteriales bacterium]|nr:T9SS type A sorting domain-containing protein [Flavobacteriales bacterium]
MRKAFLRLTLISTGLFLSVIQIHAQDKKETRIEKRVVCNADGNDKFVKIVTIENGEKTEITLTGDEADAYIIENGSLKDIGYSYSHSDDGHKKRVIVKSSSDVDIEEIETEGADVRVYKYEIPETSEGEGKTKRIEKRIIIDSEAENETSIDSEKLNEIMESIDIELSGMDELGIDAEMLKEKIRSAISETTDDNEVRVEARVHVIDISEENEEPKVVKKRVEVKKIDTEEQAEAPLEVEIFPNPSKGDFRISLDESVKGNVNLTVTDINGKVVHTEKLKASKAKDFNLDLESGVYMITVSQGKTTKSKKLIIE